MSEPLMTKEQCQRAIRAQWEEVREGIVEYLMQPVHGGSGRRSFNPKAARTAANTFIESMVFAMIPRGNASYYPPRSDR